MLVLGLFLMACGWALWHFVNTKSQKEQSEKKEVEIKQKREIETVQDMMARLFSTTQSSRTKAGMARAKAQERGAGVLSWHDPHHLEPLRKEEGRKGGFKRI